MALQRRSFISNPILESVVSEEDENRLKRLFEIRTLPISVLSKTQCQDIDELQKTSREKYTSKYYENIYARIIEVFGSEEYQPYTVGVFLIGCMKPTNLQEATESVNQGCSLLCSTSLPPPPSGGKNWGFCSQNVILCITNNSSFAQNLRLNGSKTFLQKPIIPLNSEDPNAFEFVQMVSVNSSSKAILFVDFKTIEDFPGFNFKEKAYLAHRLYISDVKLLSYSKDGLEYKDLLGEVVRVQQLKSRIEVPRADSTLPIISPIKIPVQHQDDEFTEHSWQHLSILFGAFALLAIIVIFAFRGMKAMKL